MNLTAGFAPIPSAEAAPSAGEQAQTHPRALAGVGFPAARQRISPPLSRIRPNPPLSEA